MTEALSYAQKEQRKRTLLSYIIAFSFYALVFGAGILFDIFHPQTVDFSNSTLLVNIQGPVMNDVGRGAPIEKKDSVNLEQPAPAPAPAKAIPQAKQSAPAASTTGTSLAPPEKASPAETALAPASVQEPQAAPVPPEPWVPGARAPGSRVSSSESSLLSPGEGQVPWGTGQAVRINRSEMGNSVETTLGGSSETVGQSLYVPIYLNLPLPAVVSANYFTAIPDEIIPPNTIIASSEARKRAFLNYYAKSGDEYRLMSDVPLEIREKLWEMLEDAGFDAAKANSGIDGSLNPVVIGFSVTKDKQLRGVELLQSSGNPDIDASILYGFKRAAFWNKSGETIQGRFVYRFRK
jgi:outer membrane biosynthesis protein TonB